MFASGPLHLLNPLPGMLFLFLDSQLTPWPPGPCSEIISSKKHSLTTLVWPVTPRRLWPVQQLPATLTPEYLTCGESELRHALSVKYTHQISKTLQKM